MHWKHGNAEVNNIDIHIGNILGDCSAAAAVNLAEFTNLPENIVILKHSSDFSHIFGRRIWCVILSAVTCVFWNNYTVVNVWAVVSLICRRISRIKCGIYIGRKTGAFWKNTVAVNTVLFCKVIDEETEEVALHTCVAVTACFFFVCKICDTSLLGHFNIKSRHNSRISTNLIIVTVTADHASVKADISWLERRDKA